MNDFKPLLAEVFSLSTNFAQSYEFSIGSEIFSHFAAVELEKGSLVAVVTLEKGLSLIEAKIKLTGSVALVCDRSGEDFDYQLDIDHKVIYKLGDRNETLDDDIFLIEHSTAYIDLTQIIYDLILISIPMKKLHPRFEGDGEQENLLVFASDQSDEQAIDPRWQALKNMNI